MTVSPFLGRRRMLFGGLIAAGAWQAFTAMGLNQMVDVDRSVGIWVSGLIGALLGALGYLWPVVVVSGLVYLTLLVVQLTPWPSSGIGALIREDSLPAGGADAVVVLSSSVSADGLLSDRAVDRLLEGIRLVRNGAAPRLVVSRVWGPTDNGDSVSSDVDQRRIIQGSGLSSEPQVLHPVHTTYDEALRTKEMAAREGWRSVVVVTSPSHSKRACATFEGVGLRVICRPSPDRTVAIHRRSSLNDRAAAFGLWIYEKVGWWKYRAQGRVPGSER